MIQYGALTADLTPWLLAGAAIFLRLIGLLMALPFWPMMPRIVKALTAFYLTIVIMSTLGLPAVPVDDSILNWLVILVPEFLIGLAAGLFIKVLLAAAEGMGRIVSNTIGLGFANVFNQMTGNTSDTVGRMLGLFASLAFVALDGHLWAIKGLVDSFEILAVGQGSLLNTANAGMAIAELGTQLIELSVRLAGPVIAAGLMIYTILASVSKVAPQMNLFAFGFVVTIPVGFMIVFSEMPQFVAILTDEFAQAPRSFLRWMMGG